jgi:hypothetical protein
VGKANSLDQGREGENAAVGNNGFNEWEKKSRLFARLGSSPRGTCLRLTFPTKFTEEDLGSKPPLSSKQKAQAQRILWLCRENQRERKSQDVKRPCSLLSFVKNFSNDSH